MAQFRAIMCELRSCDGSWTDSCEATKPNVLAMLSDQDPADVVGNADALCAVQRAALKKQGTTSGTNCWSFVPTTRWDLCFRILLRKGNGETGVVVPLCTGCPLHVRMTKAVERLLKRRPRPQKATSFLRLIECRAGAGVLLVTYQGFLAPVMSCQFSSARAKSVLRSSVR